MENLRTVKKQISIESLLSINERGADMLEQGKQATEARKHAQDEWILNVLRKHDIIKNERIEDIYQDIFEKELVNEASIVPFSGNSSMQIFYQGSLIGEFSNKVSIVNNKPESAHVVISYSL